MLRCITCGEEYKYCPSCMIDPDSTAWMMNYCGERCRDIGGVIHSHYHGKLNTAEATAKLDALGVYESDKFTDEVLAYISQKLTPVVTMAFEEAEDEPDAEEAEG